MDIKEAVEYLNTLPVSDFNLCLAIITLTDYVESMENGCGVCNGMKGNKVFVYCPRCGKNLGEEE